MIIKLEKPTLRRKDMDAVLQTMVDEQIGPGDHTARFVSLLQERIGISSYVVALRDRMHALRYALLGLGVGHNDYVGISALSPYLYLEVISSLGAHAVIFDIEPETGIIALQNLVSYSQHALSAIIIYEPYGNIPMDQGWIDLEIPIIEDITESFGSLYENRIAGDLGKVVVCAFEESGVVSTGGGAALLTQNQEIAERLERFIDPIYADIGLPNLNASLGIVQLLQMDRNLEKRRAIFTVYRNALMKTRHQLFGIHDIDFMMNGYGFVTILDSKPSLVQQFSLRYEVATEFAFPQCVISDQLESFDAFPNAIPYVSRGIRFPLYPFLSNQQITQVEKVISHLP